jgi:hypothetical protein
MNVELMQQCRRRRHQSGRGSAWLPGRYRNSHLDNRRNHGTATQKGRDDVMMPLTPGGQIDELRRLLRESEQRRQAAEIKLADRERQLGTAFETIATQDHRIGGMTAELARLRGAATATVLNAYALDFPHLFKSNAER